MSKPLEQPLTILDNKVLDIIKQKQPITAAAVAKLLPEVKTKEVNVAIYQKLNPNGLVVQNGLEESKPLWWTPVGLSKHQIRQMSTEAQLEDADGVMDKKEVERREWVKDQIKSDELRRRIQDVLQTGGAQSVYEIRGQITDHSLEDIVTMIEELGSLKVVTTRDDGRLTLAKKPETKHDDLRRRILDLFSPTTQYHSWHSFRKNGLVDLEIRPILKELEEAKLLNRAPGGLFCTLCQTNCPVWSLPKKPETKTLDSRSKSDLLCVVETEERPGAEIKSDQKTEVNQKRWAACMRTSNPVIAQQIMDQLASKPRTVNELSVLLEKLAIPAAEVKKILAELEDLGQVMLSLDKWVIIDKLARVARIRDNFHHLVDKLYRHNTWHVHEWHIGGKSARIRDDFHHLVDELCDLLS